MGVFVTMKIEFCNFDKFKSICVFLFRVIIINQIFTNFDECLNHFACQYPLLNPLPKFVSFFEFLGNSKAFFTIKNSLIFFFA